eukprot:2456575-Pyramimonas_sp.AAC.1
MFTYGREVNKTLHLSVAMPRCVAYHVSQELEKELYKALERTGHVTICNKRDARCGMQAKPVIEMSGFCASSNAPAPAAAAVSRTRGAAPPDATPSVRIRVTTAAAVSRTRGAAPPPASVRSKATGAAVRPPPRQLHRKAAVSNRRTSAPSRSSKG